MPGPVPKRSDQRRRRNKPAGGDVTKAPSRGSPSAPEADPGWHPIARDWFSSLAESGQAQFYEPSDWATARVWAELLSRQLESGRPSAQMIASWSAGATELLTTEGARRRARVELDKVPVVDEAAAAKVARMDAYRKAADTS
ncbi:phage terminase small subunit [Nocardiopsis protaetiae]|uniref:phage terminase small subunit n=1 Tax=Nocardiopsis protaetiae TaxID=3382270 RepID=UPI00387B49CD